MAVWKIEFPKRAREKPKVCQGEKEIGGGGAFPVSGAQVKNNWDQKRPGWTGRSGRRGSDGGGHVPSQSGWGGGNL